MTRNKREAERGERERESGVAGARTDCVKNRMDDERERASERERERERDGEKERDRRRRCE